jgi:hypothetical protein
LKSKLKHLVLQIEAKSTTKPSNPRPAGDANNVGASSRTIFARSAAAQLILPNYVLLLANSVYDFFHSLRFDVRSSLRLTLILPDPDPDLGYLRPIFGRRQGQNGRPLISRVLGTGLEADAEALIPALVENPGALRQAGCSSPVSPVACGSGSPWEGWPVLAGPCFSF